MQDAEIKMLTMLLEAEQNRKRLILSGQEGNLEDCKKNIAYIEKQIKELCKKKN